MGKLIYKYFFRNCFVENVFKFRLILEVFIICSIIYLINKLGFFKFVYSKDYDNFFNLLSVYVDK